MTTTALPLTPLAPLAAPVPRHVVALPCSLHSPAVARRIAARWLRTAGYAHTADAVLIVSELVTNAVRHTHGPCELTLTAHGGTVDIAVTDHSEDIPDLQGPAGGDRQGGLGLEIVRRLGGAITVVPRLGGKTVHAALHLHSPERERQGPPP
ncbi:ATP-binding protein [Streptomyces sp. NPDC056527]|uniref:ATP-binding protein n=1 Tax=Streptomyces sp. NPDC056527 TaxID=3345853 RepID=UPI00369AA6F6